MHDKHTTTSDPAVGSTRLVGRRWKAVINGKRRLNSKRYGATFTGGIEAADAGQTIYDLLHQLADYLETNNAEMEHPDSFQVTFPPPNDRGQARREQPKT